MTKEAGELSWFVEDWLENAPSELPMHQIWHPGEEFSEKYLLKTFDKENNEIAPTRTEGWNSENTVRK